MQQAVLQSSVMPLSHRHEGRRRLLLTAGLAAAALAVLAASSKILFGSVRAGLSYLAGERLIVDSHVKAFGEVAGDQTRRVTFRLTNRTGKEVQIIGAKSSCTCIVADHLPVSIPVAAGFDMNIQVRRGPKIGPVTEVVRYYTDCPERPEFTVRVTGTIRE